MDARGRMTPALVLTASPIPVAGGCGGDAEVSRGEHEQALAHASDDLDAAAELLDSLAGRPRRGLRLS